MKSWIVTEGMAGMQNQCLGVTEQLGLTPEIKRVGLRQPWKTLCPYIGFETAQSFTGDSLAAPWPDLAIGCGRKAVSALRYIKKASGGRCMTVFIHDPKIPGRFLDIIAVPAHDKRRGRNVVVTAAAPNRLSGEKLKAGREAWKDIFEPLPLPRIAVLIGGKSRTHDLTVEGAVQLAGQLRALAAKRCGMMVTMSRRTGAAQAAALRKGLKDGNTWIWDGQGENPYFGMLAWADFVIVTSDSVSMISEAATTGKPVYVVELTGSSKRFDKFYKNLRDKGIIRIFDGSLKSYTYQKLDDAKLIADSIRARLQGDKKS